MTGQIQSLKLEIKKLKEDLDRSKKSYADKIKQITEEFQHDKEQAEQQYHQNIQDLNLKAKKERKEGIDKAQIQIRSELLNKISELKNDHARLEAEWQRERSKFELVK